ncbi:hypothetical protein ACFYY8_29005 [Streptosporangium sp. NPDC001559]
MDLPLTGEPLALDPINTKGDHRSALLSPPLGPGAPGVGSPACPR